MHLAQRSPSANLSWQSQKKKKIISLIWLGTHDGVHMTQTRVWALTAARRKQRYANIKRRVRNQRRLAGRVFGYKRDKTAPRTWKKCQDFCVSFQWKTLFLSSGGSRPVLVHVRAELLQSPLQISIRFHSSLPAELHTSGGPHQVLWVNLRPRNRRSHFFPIVGSHWPLTRRDSTFVSAEM